MSFYLYIVWRISDWWYLAEHGSHRSSTLSRYRQIILVHINLEVANLSETLPSHASVLLKGHDGSLWSNVVRPGNASRWFVRYTSTSCELIANMKGLAAHDGYDDN